MKKKITESASRARARKYMKEKFPLLVNNKTAVHHIDGNPFNNDPSNLYIFGRGNHARHHFKGLILKNLDKLLNDYNWNK